MSTFGATLAAVLLIAGAARAGDRRVPFPMHHGIDDVGPFVRIVRPPKGTGPQIPVFQGMSYYPGWYTGEDLHKLGYDFVRVPVNPAVFLENSPQVRAQLLDQIDAAIHDYVAAGLRVVFDLHFWTTGDKTWTNQEITEDPSSSAFAQYRSLVQEVTGRLVRFPLGTVALEPLNEPIRANCQNWPSEQRTLLADIRAKAPDLPVVITGCQGELNQLVALTPDDIDMNDPNLIYTFHFYLPFVFTNQGGYKTFLQVDDLPYPASLGNMSETLAKTNANIDAAGLSPADALLNRRESTKYITQYYQQGTDRNFIEQQIGMVAAWADSNHITHSRLLMGEFAALNGRKTDTPGYRASRLRWDNDTQSVADGFQIGSAYWYLPYPKGPIFR